MAHLRGRGVALDSFEDELPTAIVLHPLAPPSQIPLEKLLLQLKGGADLLCEGKSAN